MDWNDGFKKFMHIDCIEILLFDVDYSFEFFSDFNFISTSIFFKSVDFAFYLTNNHYIVLEWIPICWKNQKLLH